MVTLEWRFRSRLLFHPSRHRHVFFSAANPFRASIAIVATAKTHGGMAESRPQEKYPAIQGGGSLMIAWQVKGKPVLVIGGGEVRDSYCLLFLCCTISMLYNISQHLPR